MGKLQINLGPRSEKLWGEIKSREEFEFMPQEGILVAMIKLYISTNQSKYIASGGPEKHTDVVTEPEATPAPPKTQPQKPDAVKPKVATPEEIAAFESDLAAILAED